MANKILTPITLWEKFNENHSLNETTLLSETIGNAVFNYVYFSGRNVGVSRVRIYGIYAQQKNAKANTIVILPDVSGKVDIDLITHFANRGYNVLSVDLAGKRDGVSDFTVYPDKISYANFEKCESTFNYVENTAKETCWYEWCAVARYAVSYAKSKSPNAKIGVLGVRHGANVAWQLTATDSRVTASAFIMGAGWLAYKDVFKHSGEDIKLDDERCRFIAGVDAHAYAQHVKVPVFYVSTTNCDEFDVDRSLDTLQRVDNQNKCWHNFTCMSKDVLGIDSLIGIEQFFDKFVSNKRIKIPSKPKIYAEVDGEDICYYVEASNPEEITSVKVYASSNDLNPSERVWFLVSDLISKKDGEYVFKRRLYGKVDFEISYAVVTYSSGITLSTNFDCQELNVYSNSKIPSVIFSSSKLTSNFIVKQFKTKLLGDVFSMNNLYDFVKGPCDIIGVSTKNTLISYSIKKLIDGLNYDSFIKFDAYTSVPDCLTIILSSSEGTEYSVSLSLEGSEVWENFSLPFTEFKTSEGIPLKRFDDIYSMTIYSMGSALVNNFLIL